MYSYGVHHRILVERLRIKKEWGDLVDEPYPWLDNDTLTRDANRAGYVPVEVVCAWYRVPPTGMGRKQ